MAFINNLLMAFEVFIVLQVLKNLEEGLAEDGSAVTIGAESRKGKPKTSTNFVSDRILGQLSI